MGKADIAVKNWLSDRERSEACGETADMGETL